MGVRRRLAVRAEVTLKSSRSRAATAGCGVEQARHKQELRAPQTARLPSRSGATSGGLSYLGRFSGGGERTRTADFHVAKVFGADFGGLR